MNKEKTKLVHYVLLARKLKEKFKFLKNKDLFL